MDVLFGRFFFNFLRVWTRVLRLASWLEGTRLHERVVSLAEKYVRPTGRFRLNPGCSWSNTGRRPVAYDGMVFGSHVTTFLLPLPTHLPKFPLILQDPSRISSQLQ